MRKDLIDEIKLALSQAEEVDRLAEENAELKAENENLRSTIAAVKRAVLTGENAFISAYPVEFRSVNGHAPPPVIDTIPSPDEPAVAAYVDREKENERQKRRERDRRRKERLETEQKKLEAERAEVKDRAAWRFGPEQTKAQAKSPPAEPTDRELDSEANEDPPPKLDEPDEDENPADRFEAMFFESKAKQPDCVLRPIKGWTAESLLEATGDLWAGEKNPTYLSDVLVCEACGAARKFTPSSDECPNCEHSVSHEGTLEFDKGVSDLCELHDEPRLTKEDIGLALRAATRHGMSGVDYAAAIQDFQGNGLTNGDILAWLARRWPKSRVFLDRSVTAGRFPCTIQFSAGVPYLWIGAYETGRPANLSGTGLLRAVRDLLEIPTPSQAAKRAKATFTGPATAESIVPEDDEGLFEPLHDDLDDGDPRSSPIEPAAKPKRGRPRKAVQP